MYICTVSIVTTVLLLPSKFTMLQRDLYSIPDQPVQLERPVSESVRLRKQWSNNLHASYRCFGDKVAGSNRIENRNGLKHTTTYIHITTYGCCPQKTIVLYVRSIYIYIYTLYIVVPCRYCSFNGHCVRFTENMSHMTIEALWSSFLHGVRRLQYMHYYTSDLRVFLK